MHQVSFQYQGVPTAVWEEIAVQEDSAHLMPAVHTTVILLIEHIINQIDRINLESQFTISAVSIIPQT